MELATLPASPPPPPPPQQQQQEDFRFSAFPAALMGANPFASAGDMEANLFLATAVTAPPSPHPFELHQSAASGVSDADPFDLFQHFTSAPASPTRAAAIYAQFDSIDGKGAADDFQPRASYSTATSTVPFYWEEKPGKLKPEFACAAATANGEVVDTEFDFGVFLDKSVQAPELTTADELFDEGKIRPLKPPPRYGSVGSSSRLRALVGSGADLDPLADALTKATKGPSPLDAGAKDAAADVGTASSPKKPDPATSPRSIPPATKMNGWRKKWRLSDMLLFRRSAPKARAAGNISKDPIFKYSPVQQLGTPAKKTSAESVAAANGDAFAGKHRRQSKTAAAAAEEGMSSSHRQSVMGCVRLNHDIHWLAKGLNGSSLHFGHRRTARSSAMTG
ncbi:hypothetical protein GUJ93_ZPchr0006g45945 [Zizania palustris]|uniref:Uncharacterized protein n=1 Tax=Zizania palustris TaxID=103762 RepID=A0A8J5TD51_ZIZPA|nr:hypothetical protein GUJ93_ZPchr0006g45945 [Zizania palustris]